MTTGRRQQVVTSAAALGGSLLFAYSIWRFGARDILDGIQRVGFGLLPILGLGGLRFLVRTQCWRLCMPAGTRLPLRRALVAFLAGDALGNITPLGLVASEPTKVFLTRHHLATHESVASLAVDNLLYASSVVAMVAIGVIVLLVTVPLPFEWQEAAVAVLGAFALVALVILRLLKRSRRTGRMAGRTPPRWLERLVSVRVSIGAFSSGHPGRIWAVFALNMAFHVLAVFEAFVTLRWLLGEHGPTLTQAIVFEALNRVIIVVFKFVPLRVGVDEALSGAFAQVLSVSPAAGVALAVVRKVRNLFWGGVGLVLIAAHPAQAAPATGRPGSVSAHRT